MPPPVPGTAELPLIVQLLTVSGPLPKEPSLKMPPPWPKLSVGAELPLIVQLLSVRVA